MASDTYHPMTSCMNVILVSQIFCKLNVKRCSRTAFMSPYDLMRVKVIEQSDSVGKWEAMDVFLQHVQFFI